MQKWSSSYTDRIYAAKKIYLIDTGIKTLLTGKRDLGAKAENAVFVHFKRKNEACGYYAESQREVDKEVLIISKESELEMKEKNITIKVMPLWKFLMSSRNFS